MNKNKPPKGFWRELCTLDRQMHQTAEEQIPGGIRSRLGRKHWSWYDPEYISQPGLADEGRMAASWTSVRILGGFMTYATVDAFRLISNDTVDPEHMPDVLPVVHERFTYCGIMLAGLGFVVFDQGPDNFADLAKGEPSSLPEIDFNNFSIRKHIPGVSPSTEDYNRLLLYLRFGVEGGPQEPPEPPVEPPYVTV